MLVLNTSQPKRLYTTPEIISAEWQNIAQINWSSNTQTLWFNKTNKYVYILHARTDAPWLMIDRYTYDTNWKLSAKTPMTLSGFGTFTSEPTLLTFQGSHSWNFYIICSWEAWSASFAQYWIYPVSISWTTVTLWSTLSTPSVASYAPNRAFAVGAVVYVFYRHTSTSVVGVGRKYSWSWSTLSGAALPTNIISDIDDGASIAGSYGYNWNFQRLNTIWAGSSNDKFFHLFMGSGYGRKTNLKFDAATDTWSASDYFFDKVIWEINWNIILHYETTQNTYILNTSLTLIWKLHWHDFWQLSSMKYCWNIVDLDNGIWIFRFNTDNITTFWFFSDAAKRIWKVSCLEQDWCGIIFKIDSWEWKNFIPTSITQIIELDYYWETSLKMFVTKKTGTLFVEVTD